MLPPEDLPLCSQLPKVPDTEDVFGQRVASDERLGRGGRKGRNACTLGPAESFRSRGHVEPGGCALAVLWDQANFSELAPELTSTFLIFINLV